ncbi:hypothetical protein JCM19238_693 [Vibrio ponticus]|nr:hypothetical protein JCM19238_693 [Vibrio ponticus]
MVDCFYANRYVTNLLVSEMLLPLILESHNGPVDMDLPSLG